MSNRFEDIWNNFHERLSVFVGKRIFDREMTDDCVQEIFIKIYTGLSSLRDNRKLESWIFQIARNTIVDQNRQIIKYATLPVNNQDRETESDGNKNEEIAKSIVPFIKQLPSKYSNPLMQYEIEGLSQKEISEKENISLSGAKSRIQRGRLKLIKALNECCRFEIDKHGNVLDYCQKQNSRKKC